MSTPDEQVTITRLIHQFGIDPDLAWRTQTCRRLATIRNWLGIRYTGSLIQDKFKHGAWYGWVNTPRRSHYGRVIENHGTVWPDRTHQPEPDSDIAPYVAPPEGWVYTP